MMFARPDGARMTQREFVMCALNIAWSEPFVAPEWILCGGNSAQRSHGSSLVVDRVVLDADRSRV
jgi:hypothetical protein